MTTVGSWNLNKLRIASLIFSTISTLGLNLWILIFCLSLAMFISQAAQLEQPVLEVEIFQAFHQMGPLKTSGPDGIPAAFYQKYWNTVHTDITNMVKAFFHSGFILKSLNHTFITLSPKIPTPKKISQFRPISLYNVTYKIISKILIN